MAQEVGSGGHHALELHLQGLTATQKNLAEDTVLRKTEDGRSALSASQGWGGVMGAPVGRTHIGKRGSVE